MKVINDDDEEEEEEGEESGVSQSTYHRVPIRKLECQSQMHTT